MTVFGIKVQFRLTHIVLAMVLVLASGLPQALPAMAQSGERSLYLYYTHTRETVRIVYKRNGQYVQSGLRELNQFLRDWRRNEPATMDPRLFDLVWQVYNEVGGSGPIQIVSAYRSPATNAMLAANSSGVADNSQHMRGTALDFFIPGVPLNRLRAAAMKIQAGGVGYYPTSGSPFVHLDTGNVRAWPRMTKAQLQEIFPDGRTLHVPTSGTPISQEGYRYAQAQWQECRRVPCSGGGGSDTRVAGGGNTLVDMLFGGGNDDAPAATTQVASAAQAPTRSGPRVAPTPMMRPGSTLVASAETAVEAIPFATSGSDPLAAASFAPMPALKSAVLVAETTRTIPAGAETAVMAIAALDAPVPAPRILMSDRDQTLVAAYSPIAPDAQRAVEAIIASESNDVAAAAEPQLRLGGLGSLTTGSLGGALPQLRPANTDAAVNTLFEGTWGVVASAEASPAIEAAAARAAGAALEMRQAALVAPDLDHVVEMLIVPELMTSSHFAVIFEHDEADFDPATELGALVPAMGVGDFAQSIANTAFTAGRPLVLAAR